MGGLAFASIMAKLRKWRMLVPERHRNGAVSMGQRNTCLTRLLAGVLRAKVGREG